MYRLDTLKGVTFPEGLIHEDIPTTYKALLKCNKVAYTSEELYRYQIREKKLHTQVGENYMTFLCGKISAFLKAKIMRIMRLHIMYFRRQVGYDIISASKNMEDFYLKEPRS